jgi:hypothetical protein
MDCSFVSPFIELPLELIFHIVKELPLKERIKLSMTNRHLREALTEFIFEEVNLTTEDIFNPSTTMALRKLFESNLSPARKTKRIKILIKTCDHYYDGWGSTVPAWCDRCLQKVTNILTNFKHATVLELKPVGNGIYFLCPLSKVFSVLSAMMPNVTKYEVNMGPVNFLDGLSTLRSPVISNTLIINYDNSVEVEIDSWLGHGHLQAPLDGYENLELRDYPKNALFFSTVFQWFTGLKHLTVTWDDTPFIHHDGLFSIVARISHFCSNLESLTFGTSIDRNYEKLGSHDVDLGLGALQSLKKVHILGFIPEVNEAFAFARTWTHQEEFVWETTFTNFRLRESRFVLFLMKVVQELRSGDMSIKLKVIKLILRGEPLRRPGMKGIAVRHIVCPDSPCTCSHLDNFQLSTTPGYHVDMNHIMVLEGLSFDGDTEDLLFFMNVAIRRLALNAVAFETIRPDVSYG